MLTEAQREVLTAGPMSISVFSEKLSLDEGLALVRAGYVDFTFPIMGPEAQVATTPAGRAALAETEGGGDV